MEEQKDLNQLVEKVVYDYFNLKEIENLMEYGCDSDEGLYHLTFLYQDILDELNIKYDYIYTEDGLSDGKYVTTIGFKDKQEIKVDTSAWNGKEIIFENIKYIYESFFNIK